MQKIPEIVEFKIKVSDDQRTIRAAEFSACGTRIVIVDDQRALYAVGNRLRCITHSSQQRRSVCLLRVYK